MVEIGARFRRDCEGFRGGHVGVACCGNVRVQDWARGIRDIKDEDSRGALCAKEHEGLAAYSGQRH